MNKRMFMLLLSAHAIHGLVSIGRNITPGKKQVSACAQPRDIVKEIVGLCEALKVKTILDIGCGDFWMRKMRMPNMRYIGVDTSPEKIVKSRIRYADKEHLFLCADPLEDSLPTADMVIGAHMLQNVRAKEALLLLRALKATESMFLLMSMPKKKLRVACGLPKPLIKISGRNEDGDDEAWGLWLLQDLEV